MSLPSNKKETARCALCAAMPDLVAAYVFDSQAQGTARPKSDVDLAVLGAAPLRADKRWDLQGQLTDALAAEVDLVDLRAVSTVMQMQVVSTSAVLYERDRAARARFEMYVFSAYALLNEERAAISARRSWNGSGTREASMADDVVLGKAAIIERCLQRIRDEYAGDARRLFDDITRQDAILLNLQRACQAAIDLAMYAVARSASACRRRAARPSLRW